MAQFIRKIAPTRDRQLVIANDRFAQGPAKHMEVGGKREKESTKCAPKVLPRVVPGASTRFYLPFGQSI
ncbi:MAG: hypothetical protein ACFB0B_22920 [Thermonemataceae bacterium]